MIPYYPPFRYENMNVIKEVLHFPILCNCHKKSAVGTVVSSFSKHKSVLHMKI